MRNISTITPACLFKGLLFFVHREKFVWSILWNPFMLWHETLRIAEQWSLTLIFSLCKVIGLLLILFFCHNGYKSFGTALKLEKTERKKLDKMHKYYPSPGKWDPDMHIYYLFVQWCSWYIYLYWLGIALMNNLCIWSVTVNWYVVLVYVV